MSNVQQAIARSRAIVQETMALTKSNTIGSNKENRPIDRSIESFRFTMTDDPLISKTISPLKSRDDSYSLSNAQYLQEMVQELEKGNCRDEVMVLKTQNRELIQQNKDLRERMAKMKSDYCKQILELQQRYQHSLQLQDELNNKLKKPNNLREQLINARDQISNIEQEYSSYCQSLKQTIESEKLKNSKLQYQLKVAKSQLVDYSKVLERLQELEAKEQADMLEVTLNDNVNASYEEEISHNAQAIQKLEKKLIQTQRLAPRKSKTKVKSTNVTPKKPAIKGKRVLTPRRGK